jgi:hypothetical protein
MFTVEWRLADSTDRHGGILPGSSLTGLTVVLPHLDSLYERCHWLVRFRGAVPAFCHIGKLRPESELETSTGETGTISGTITDEQGAGIPWANLFLYRAELSASTESTGKFTIPKVPIGAYRLAARGYGFDPCDRADLRVLANDTTRADFHLARTKPIQGPAFLPALYSATPCPKPAKVNMTTWRSVRFDEQLAFRITPGFVFDSTARFIEGGHLWREGKRSIEVVNGYWGTGSFGESNSCTTSIAGTTFLVTTGHSRWDSRYNASILRAADYGSRHYSMLLGCHSPKKSDLELFLTMFYTLKPDSVAPWK